VSQTRMEVKNSPCSIPSFINDYASFGSFERHTRDIGLKLLKKMGYKGGGLGIDGKGIIQPLEVEGRPRCAGLGYGERECSKVVEAKDSSRKELRSSPTSSWDNKSVAKYLERKSLYSEGEKDMKSHNYFTHCQMSGHLRRKC
jgi:hypothetical protein